MAHLKETTVEFKISMHCNACERTVAKIISKFKGVVTFTTDMINHKVVVTGSIDPLKLFKKLRKKTGKKVEIIENKEEDDRDNILENSPPERSLSPVGVPLRPLVFYSSCCREDLLMVFSDENPNACSIM
ncbi:Heavy metal-associated isoprenylated plant protein 19 [Euphorbia peplus]|nr:Heavy metal-associated isoprenylated plant protein 19 [Euphorbia peplus]